MKVVKVLCFSTMENTRTNELDLTGSGLNDINMWAANGFAGQQVNLTGQQIICCPVGKRLLGGKLTQMSQKSQASQPAEFPTNFKSRKSVSLTQT